MLQLFCGDKDTLQCFIDCIKTSFSGKLMRYLFICSGNGSNGKSTIFKVLGEIFGRFMDTISNKVVILTKSQSNLNTEIEKLDKIRVGFLSELPENSKLNEEVIKKISGGDRIDLRTIQKTNFTIYPTSTIWFAVNQEPKFNTDTDNGKAMINRIVNFPFNNSFENNSGFEDLVLSKKDEIFSYIMKYGNIKPTVTPSSLMIEKKLQYISDQQDNDFLKCFIDEKIIMNIPTIDGYGKRNSWCIKRDNFINSFNYWYRGKYPDSKLPQETPVKFTKKLLKYGIKSKESNHIVWYENIQERESLDEDTEE